MTGRWRGHRRRRARRAGGRLWPWLTAGASSSSSSSVYTEWTRELPGDAPRYNIPPQTPPSLPQEAPFRVRCPVTGRGRAAETDGVSQRQSWARQTCMRRSKIPSVRNGIQIIIIARVSRQAEALALCEPWGRFRVQINKKECAGKE